jgi:hypothetical protein
MRVRPDTPSISGCATRAYLLISQKRFCTSIKWRRLPNSPPNERSVVAEPVLLLVGHTPMIPAASRKSAPG